MTIKSSLTDQTAWLNQCVGHYNHRFFYMYMVYMVLGTIFVMAFGHDILLKEYYRERTELALDQTARPPDNVTEVRETPEVSHNLTEVTGVSCWQKEGRS